MFLLASIKAIKNSKCCGTDVLFDADPDQDKDSDLDADLDANILKDFSISG
jgi:hypothetical protein